MTEPLTREDIQRIINGTHPSMPGSAIWDELADTALHYEARLREVEAERDALKAHVGDAPTMERLRSAHSAMPAAVTLYPDQPGGHRVYKQGHDEQCYICAAIERAEKVEARVAELEEENETLHDKLAQALRMDRAEYDAARRL